MIYHEISPDAFNEWLNYNPSRKGHAMTTTMIAPFSITTPYFTDARGTNINHSRCAHDATPAGRRNCRKAVQEIRDASQK